MTKKFITLSIFFSLLSTLMIGCSTQYNIATGEQETLFYSTEREVKIGNSISKNVEEGYEIIEDEELNERLNKIGESIVAVCDRKEIEYHFAIIEPKEEDKREEGLEINAFALPGGFIYVYKDLMDSVRSDDELAGVLAHEIGHIVAKHSIKKLQAMMGYMLARIATIAAPGPTVGGEVDYAFQQIMLGYGREDELLADKLAVKYMKLVGYNAEKMIDFLQLLKEVDKNKPLRQLSYGRSHPYISDRIANIKRNLGMPLDFEDVINIDQEY